MTDSGQTSSIVTLVWFKDLIRVWWPWPNFQVHHSIKTVKFWPKKKKKKKKKLVCTPSLESNNGFWSNFIYCIFLSFFLWYRIYLFIYLIKNAFILCRIVNTAGMVLYQKWATSWENYFKPYANNIGADPPAHPRRLISTFVVFFLDDTI